MLVSQQKVHFSRAGRYLHVCNVRSQNGWTHLPAGAKCILGSGRGGVVYVRLQPRSPFVMAEMLLPWVLVWVSGNSTPLPLCAFICIHASLFCFLTRFFICQLNNNKRKYMLIETEGQCGPWNAFIRKLSCLVILLAKKKGNNIHTFCRRFALKWIINIVEISKIFNSHGHFYCQYTCFGNTLFLDVHNTE